jgi:arabinose-5-phosphate isomerase
VASCESLERDAHFSMSRTIPIREARRTAKSSAGAKDEPESDLAAARRVLSYAKDALEQMAETLDGQFSRAVDMLLAVKGRVIVTGMGKSGHVGRKIAATLSSTGTPAQFVHPGEASHGDLGMLTRDDAVIALSNSGETAELSDLVTYAKRFAIPLLGIAGNANSTLLQAADVALVLPPLREACAIGMAPTTSTTAMIVLGDALAVALMERKRFSAEQYRDLHPAGALGRALIRVSDIMHKGEELPLVPAGAAMKDVLLAMTSGRFGFAGVAGVVDADGSLVGIITDGDLRRHMERNLLDRVAKDVMTKNPKTVGPAMLAAEALAFMNDSSPKVTSLFVVEQGARRTPIGFLGIHDCLRAGLR